MSYEIETEKESILARADAGRERSQEKTFHSGSSWKLEIPSHQAIWDLCHQLPTREGSSLFASSLLNLNCLPTQASHPEVLFVISRAYKNRPSHAPRLRLWVVSTGWPGLRVLL